MCPQKILKLSLEVDVGAKAFLVPIEQGMGIGLLWLVLH